MRKSLYQYAVLRHFIDDEGDEQTELASPITEVLAVSEESVKIEAARSVKDEDLDCEELEIIIVPFA